MTNLAEKISSGQIKFLIKEREFVYLHPKNKKESAHFGIYQGTRYSESMKEDGILINLFLSFNYEKISGVNIWIPDRFLARDITLISPTSDIVKEKTSLYVGRGIKEGMKENDNYYNYCLIEEIMKQYNFY